MILIKSVQHQIIVFSDCVTAIFTSYDTNIQYITSVSFCSREKVSIYKTGMGDVFMF